MDACLSSWDTPQWTNIHHHHHHHQMAMTTPGGVHIPSFILMDPTIQDSPSMAEPPPGTGYAAWGEGAPSLLMMTQHQQAMLLSPLESGLMGFDGPTKGTTTSGGGSMDHHLLSRSTSNTADTTTASNNSADQDPDDGTISRIFSDCQTLLNFSPPNNSNNNNNPKKRNYDDSEKDCSEAGFKLVREIVTSSAGPANKKSKTVSGPCRLSTSSNISFSFQNGTNSSGSSTMEEPDGEAIQQMKEMIYRAAAFRPVNFGVEVVERPKRKNVRISSDPQTVAARQRRERISERLRVLQKLVPGGTKMDTASMLDEAANYLKFLRNQVKSLETFGTITTNNSPSQNLQFSSSLFQQHPLIIPMQQPHNHPTFSLQNPTKHQQQQQLTHHNVPKS